MKPLLLLLALLLAACSSGPKPASSSAGKPPARPPILEAFPLARDRQLAAYQEALLRARPSSGPRLQALIVRSKRWAPGSTLTVAFHGGSRELHREIAQTASLWANSINLGLDFGFNPETNSYRTWSPADSNYSAQIRIGFDELGYFSCVGTDSVSPGCATPQQSSMNFQEFDRALPPRWRATVLHEFGHAFGFEHEHQSPASPCDNFFRFDDDPGYVETRTPDGVLVNDSQGRRPGIYAVMSGAPNNWDRNKVDRNFRRLPASSAYLRTQFDPRSIMMYEFEPDLFIPGPPAACVAQRNEDLSALDRQGASAAYPRQPADMFRNRNEISAAIGEIMGAGPLADNFKSSFLEQKKLLQAIK